MESQSFKKEVPSFKMHVPGCRTYDPCVSSEVASLKLRLNPVSACQNRLASSEGARPKPLVRDLRWHSSATLRGGRFLMSEVTL